MPWRAAHIQVLPASLQEQTCPGHLTYGTTQSPVVLLPQTLILDSGPGILDSEDQGHPEQESTLYTLWTCGLCLSSPAHGPQDEQGSPGGPNGPGAWGGLLAAGPSAHCATAKAPECRAVLRDLQTRLVALCTADRPRPDPFSLVKSGVSGEPLGRGGRAHVGAGLSCPTQGHLGAEWKDSEDTMPHRSRGHWG